MKQNVLAMAIASFALSAGAGTVTSDGQDIVISTKGGFKVNTVDKKNSFQLGGRLQWDYDSFSDAYGDGTASELRRGRLYAKGVVNKDWEYKIQLEWAAEENDDGSQKVDLEDAYIKYKGLPVYVKGGRFKVAFGLEEQTSSKDISTIERAAFWDFVEVPRRDLSVEVGQAKGNYTWALGLYENEDGEEVGITDSGGDLTYTWGGRVTFAPIDDGNNVLHLGLGLIMTDYDDNPQRARLRSRFGVHTTGRTELVDLGGGTATESDQLGLEAAWVNGPFSLQGEWVQYDVDTIASEPNVEFDGYYLQATYTLTGEARKYKKGAFKRIKPGSETGAWELVAKYEAGEAEANGSSEYNLLTLGVNWYVNENVRLSANYLMSSFDILAADGADPLVAGQDDGDAISFRAQYAF